MSLVLCRLHVLSRKSFLEKLNLQRYTHFLHKLIDSKRTKNWLPDVNEQSYRTLLAMILVFAIYNVQKSDFSIHHLCA